ncbi:MAG: 50S ribosomal protein L18 [Parachlamydiaceae bacterium]
MLSELLNKHRLRQRRKVRVRKALRGTSVKPRLCVIKSNKHIQAQLIDDEKGVTLASVATYSKEFRNTDFGRKSKASAKVLGEKIASKAIELGCSEIVFDRGPFKYHGVLAELANGAREAGLKF